MTTRGTPQKRKRKCERRPKLLATTATLDGNEQTMATDRTFEPDPDFDPVLVMPVHTHGRRPGYAYGLELDDEAIPDVAMVLADLIDRWTADYEKRLQ